MHRSRKLLRRVFNIFEFIFGMIGKLKSIDSLADRYWQISMNNI